MRHGSRTRILLALALVFAVLGGEATAEAASGSGLEEQPVVRRQLLLRGKRHELTADLGATMADAFARNWLLSVGYQYNVNNWLGVGLSLSANLCGVMGDLCKTGLAEEVEAAHPRIDTLDDLSVFKFVVSPYLSLVPISGKFGVLGKVMHYDLHLIVGGALVSLGSLGDDSTLDDTAFGPVIGVGHRVFVTDSFALTLGMKDIILSRALNANESGEAADPGYENNFILSLSASFYFPSQLEVSQ